MDVDGCWNGESMSLNEEIMNVGLEEVEFDCLENSIARPWDQKNTLTPPWVRDDAGPFLQGPSRNDKTAARFSYGPP